MNFKRFAVLLSISLIGLPAFAAPTPEEALASLKEGNRRYLEGVSKHPRIDPIRRLKTAKEGQLPIASVLSCSDARVPVELVFDKGFGDIFVVRVAGNVCAMAEMASLEYGALYLHTPLIVVLGHSKCGAVKAAIGGGMDLKGTLPLLMQEIHPAVDAVRGKGKDFKEQEFENAVIEENVRLARQEILKSSGISQAVKDGKVMIVGAIRDLKTGEVRWLD